MAAREGREWRERKMEEDAVREMMTGLKKEGRDFRVRVLGVGDWWEDWIRVRVLGMEGFRVLEKGRDSMCVGR